MAARNLCAVYVSVTTLDAAGVPVGYDWTLFRPPRRDGDGRQATLF